jgi:hypothetical protein
MWREARLGQAAPEQAAEAMMLALELDHPVMAASIYRWRNSSKVPC